MKVICGDGGAEYRELRKESAESGEIADFLQAWSELATRRRATKANDTLRLRKNRTVCAPTNTTRMRSTDDHMSTRVWFGNDGGDAASMPARALHDFYDGMSPPRVYPERLVSSLSGSQTRHCSVRADMWWRSLSSLQGSAILRNQWGLDGAHPAPLSTPPLVCEISA